MNELVQNASSENHAAVAQHDNGLFNIDYIGESDSAEDGLSENRQSEARNEMGDIIDASYTLDLDKPNGREMYGLLETRASPNRNNLTEDIIDINYTLNIDEPNDMNMEENREYESYTLNIDELHGVSEIRENETRNDLGDTLSAIENLYVECITVAETVAEGILPSCDLVTTMCDDQQGDTQPCLRDYNPGSSDLKYPLNDGEKMCSPQPYDFKYSVDESEKICDGESCDFKHSVDDG